MLHNTMDTELSSLATPSTEEVVGVVGDAVEDVVWDVVGDEVVVEAHWKYCSNDSDAISGKWIALPRFGFPREATFRVESSCK